MFLLFRISIKCQMTCTTYLHDVYYTIDVLLNHNNDMRGALNIKEYKIIVLINTFKAHIIHSIIIYRLSSGINHTLTCAIVGGFLSFENFFF